METKVYSYKGLINAYLMQKRYANAAKPLQKYYADLYKHLKNYFGTDLDTLEQKEEYSPERAGLSQLFGLTLACYYHASNPFESMVEAPKIISDLCDKHSKLLNEHMESYKEECFALLCDMYCIMYGETDKKISSQELKKLGFNDMEEPDPLDYL